MSVTALLPSAHAATDPRPDLRLLLGVATPVLDPPTPGARPVPEHGADVGAPVPAERSGSHVEDRHLPRVIVDADAARRARVSRRATALARNVRAIQWLLLLALWSVAFAYAVPSIADVTGDAVTLSFDLWGRTDATVAGD